MSLEIFRPIPGYGNRYDVTSWGRVYDKKLGRFLIPEETKKGYLRVNLFDDAGKHHMRVHRLVANAFIENPDGKPQVNHVDGNKQNNSFTNLEWATNDENREAAESLKRMMIERSE